MKSGSKGLVVYNKKVLLYLRDNKPNIPYPNFWDMPGGGKDKGETYKQAALREIEEEFGITPNSFHFIGYEIYSGRKAYRFVAFIDNKDYKKISLGKEGQNYRFFSIEEALAKKLIPGLKEFLKQNEVILKEIIENQGTITPSKFVLANK